MKVLTADNDKPVLCLFATRDTIAGEEILYDYGQKNYLWENKPTSKKRPQRDMVKEKIPQKTDELAFVNVMHEVEKIVEKNCEKPTSKKRPQPDMVKEMIMEKSDEISSRDDTHNSTNAEQQSSRQDQFTSAKIATTSAEVDTDSQKERNTGSENLSKIVDIDKD
ncbi:Hypothetical predicted protein, partial [Paramuricea clavata]